MHKLFASQLETERIYLVIRQHWIFLISKLFFLILLTILVVVARSAGPIYLPDMFTGDFAPAVILGFDCAYIILIFAYFIVILLYYLNMQIITDQRIVDIDQIGLFGRNVSELQIENIEDSTSESHGIFATIFNYGNVFIQTAGTKERFEFDNIAHPEEVKKLVLDLYEKVTANRPETKP